MNRRRHYIVNRRYQFKYIGAFVTVAALSAVLSGAIMVHQLDRQVEEYIQRQTVEIARTGEIVLPIAFKVSFGVFAIEFIALALMTLFYFRKTSNLALRLQSAIGRFKDGELSASCLFDCGRDFDTVEAAFNDMVKANHERLTEAKSAAEGVAGAVNALMDGGAGQLTAVNVRELRACIEKLDLALSDYKT